MAKSTQQKAELERLIRISEASRLRLSDAHSAFKNRLNAPARLAGSLKAEPSKWIGGSLVAGFLASRLFGSKKKPSGRVKEVKKQRNFLFGTLALAAAVAKPVARIYATNLVKDYLGKRFHSGIAARHMPRSISRH